MTRRYEITTDDSKHFESLIADYIKAGFDLTFYDSFAATLYKRSSEEVVNIFVDL